MRFNLGAEPPKPPGYRRAPCCYNCVVFNGKLGVCGLSKYGFVPIWTYVCNNFQDKKKVLGPNA